jgi:choline-sulfatase
LSPKPNLLMLMADQHRADCVAAYGNSAIHTPNLDRLAGGVKFTAAYSSTPTCTPARACLLTGMSPWGHGMLGYSRVAQRYPVEMPRLLRDAGYFTTGIGKMHWTPQRNLHGFHQTFLDESGRAESADFRSDYRSWFYSEMPNGNPDATGLDWNGYTAADYALPERLHPTAWTGNTTVNFIREYSRPEPFFLKVSFARPHSPYDPPRRVMDRYREASVPAARAGVWAHRYRARNSDQVNIWHGELSPEQVRHSRRAYYANVTFIDEQVGRILEVLEQRRMLDNTVILYFSDHGDMLGDHHLWRKSYAYEASARIPMLLYTPGLRGKTVARPVELRDVLPTLLDAAGVEAPPAIEGRSMLRLARNPQGDWRKWIDLEHDVCYSPDNHWNALTDGRMKYIYHAKSGEEQIFDLAADPAEFDPVPDPAALRLWRGRMIEHLAPRGEAWVANGNLALRPASQLHSPNYPRG